MSVFLLATGTQAPEHSIAQEDAARIAQALRITERWLDALPRLYRRTGVARRGSVLLTASQGELGQCQTFYSPASELAPSGPTTGQRMQAYAEHAGPLLERACRKSLSDAAIAADRITHLVTVSCTGFCAPGVDHELIERLELSPSVQRTHVGFMGCHGLINGLRIAAAIAQSDPRAVALVGAVELCSLHQQYSNDPQQLVANALFADGAASALLAGPKAIEPHSRPRWEVVGSESCWIPNTTAEMGWWIGDHGFQMRLSPQVPAIIEASLCGPVDAWLARCGVSRSDVSYWAIHPGGERILDATSSALSLDASKMAASRAILREFGNMSSPTVLFIFERFMREMRTDEPCVLIAFGPGLHAEMLLLRRTGTEGGTDR